MAFRLCAGLAAVAGGRRQRPAQRLLRPTAGPWPSLREEAFHSSPLPTTVLPPDMCRDLLLKQAAPAAVRLHSPPPLYGPDTALCQDRAQGQASLSFSPSTAWNHVTYRGLFLRNLSGLVQSPNGRRAFLVDTLALVKRLEAQGLTAKQAEAITAVITEVLNDSLENAGHSFSSKTDMQRTELLQEAALSKFKAEMQSTQDHHFTTLQRETERLRTDIEKMRSELRYEIDKVTAGQRLDLNLEKGRIREELATQSQETAELTNKLDREINTLRTRVEAAKYEVIQYCIGTIVSVTAVGLGLLRVLM
eukprot:SM000160S02558  [mRNA]  locus=s160:247189:249484:- [translate_table: standard]